MLIDFTVVATILGNAVAAPEPLPVHDVKNVSRSILADCLDPSFD